MYITCVYTAHMCSKNIYYHVSAKPICRDYVRMSFYIIYIHIYSVLYFCSYLCLACLYKQNVVKLSAEIHFFAILQGAINLFKNNFSVSRSY